MVSFAASSLSSKRRVGNIFVGMCAVMMLVMKTSKAFQPTITTTKLNVPPQSMKVWGNNIIKTQETRPTNSMRLWAGRGGRGGRNNQKPKKEDRPVMNDEIRANELRVVAAAAGGGKDEPLGVLSLQDALAKAKEMGNLDLIMINDKSDPPVCKIVDYSKYRYALEKKAKEVKKNSKATEIKEVKMSYKIDVHDYDVRKRNAEKFIRQGNRVKCTVMFRGREVQHTQLGYELLSKLSDDLDEYGAAEGKPKRDGRNLSLILSPKAEILKAINEGRKAEEKAKKKKKAQQLEARKEKKEIEAAAEMAAVATATAVAAAVEEDTTDDELSLDDLLGSDDLTDSLFS